MLKARHIWYLNGFLALVAFFITYKIWFSPKEDAWRLIPDNAFLVIESTTLQNNLYEKDSLGGAALSEIPFFFDALENLRLVANELPNTALKKKLLHQKLISYSLHREAKRNLEYIVYIPIENNEEEINAILASNSSEKRVFGQTTNGFEIKRLKKNSAEDLFSFFVHNNYLVCSRSVLLLEAVIDKITSKKPALDKVPFVESRNSLAHFYVKTRNLMDISDVLPTELSPNLRSYFRNVTPFNPDLVFSKVADSENIEGYVLSNSSIEVPFLSAFGSQKGSALTATTLIPENTAFFLRLAFHKAADLAVNMNIYLRQKDELFIEKKDSVSALLGKDIDQLYGVIDKEAMLCEMETVTDEPSNKIALFHSSNPSQFRQLLTDLGRATDPYVSFKSSPLSILNQTVIKLEIAELPALLFGSSFSGFSSCFYAIRGNYVIMANSQAAMESYLSQLSLGQTWGQSKIHTDLVKRLSPKAQVTAVVNPQKIWNNIFFSLPDKWQSSVIKHEGRFKNLRLIAIENFVSQKQFGTKLHLQKNTSANSEFANQLLLQEATEFPEEIIGSPYVIVNPTTRKEEVFLQTNRQIFLAGTSSKLQNSVIIDAPIRKQPQAFDFFQNGRLQHITHTNKALYVLERTANEFTAFVPEMNISGTINHLTTQPSKVIVGTTSGELFKISKNKEVTQIPTIAPKRAIIAIKAITHKNSPLVATLQQDGTLSLFYENSGALLNNFPQLPLQTRPVAMVEEKDENGTSYLLLLSEMGEVKGIDFDGRMVEKAATQLIKKSKSATFELLTDQRSNDWLFLQRHSGGLIVFNKKGESILEIESPFSAELKVGYFNLGSDLRIIAIFDGTNSTFFDTKGSQIGNKPLPSTALPYLSFEEYYNKLLIYTPNGKRLEKWGIKLK